MLGIKLHNQKLTEILNLPNQEVVGMQSFEGIGIVLHIESQRKGGVCPRCGSKSDRIHENHYHTIQDLAWGVNDVYLRINARQFKCEKCGKPFTEELEYKPLRRGYTNRLANDVIEQVRGSTILAVSQRSGLSEYQIQNMLDDLWEELNGKKPVGLKRLGIDEIAWRKGGKNFCAVLVNLDTHKIIGLVKSRTKDELSKTLKEWGSEILEGVEYVSIDLWRPYETVVKELMPNVEVVADRFHVMKIVNEELDSKRKEERRESKKIENKLEREQIEEGLKNSKYILLRNEEDLDEDQRGRLEKIKSVSPELAEMHRLKEDFRAIFEEEKTWASGSLRLLDWLVAAQDKFTSACKTIVNWIDEITMYFECPISNGCVEGINNRLKQLKHAAYGFRNFSNFVTRAMLF